MGCTVYKTAPEPFALLEASLNPYTNVLILDVAALKTLEPWVIKRIKKGSPRIKIIVVGSNHRDFDTVIRYSDIDGYIPANASADDLSAAIDKVTRDSQFSNAWVMDFNPMVLAQTSVPIVRRSLSMVIINRRDHKLQALHDSISDIPLLEIQAHVHDLQTAIAKVTMLQPQVILLHMEALTFGDVITVAEIRCRVPDVKIIAVSGKHSKVDWDCLKLCDGFIPLDEPRAKVVEAIVDTVSDTKGIDSSVIDSIRRNAYFSPSGGYRVPLHVVGQRSYSQQVTASMANRAMIVAANNRRRNINAALVLAAAIFLVQVLFIAMFHYEPPVVHEAYGGPSTGPTAPIPGIAYTVSELQCRKWNRYRGDAYRDDTVTNSSFSPGW